MKLNRPICFGGALFVLGALVGLLLPQRYIEEAEEYVSQSMGELALWKPSAPKPSAAKPLPGEVLSNEPLSKELSIESTKPSKQSSRAPVPQLPEGAIEGEMLLHFTNRWHYRDYLKALAAAGTEPIGQIDELFVVRVNADLMAGSNPERYGGHASLSFRVERPQPPAVDDLSQRLKGFRQSARSIVGGLVEGDGSGVMVGILDSGISPHPQFDDEYTGHADLVGGGVSGAGAAHGTAVASIVAGAEGVAPAAELFVVRVLDDQGLGTCFDVAQGIVLAADLGAKVLNLSLGVYQDTPVLREAVRYAHARDVIMVAAAGNDGYTQMPYPAAYPEVLAVTAVDGLGNQAHFSNQSTEIDFAAPGVGVVAAQGDAGTGLFSGTSAAAPFVSGTLASILSSSEVQTGTQAVELMKRYLDDAGAPGVDAVYGEGVVNWDRLRERNTTSVQDVALADIYLSPDALPGTTMPVEVTVQNRGTSWLRASTLSVRVDEAQPVDFTIGSLGPGHTTTRKVYTQVPSVDQGGALTVEAQVFPRGGLDEVRVGNNVKSVLFRPRQPL
jgi:subtilisin family serine protease